MYIYIYVYTVYMYICKLMCINLEIPDKGNKKKANKVHDAHLRNRSMQKSGWWRNDQSQWDIEPGLPPLYTGTLCTFYFKDDDNFAHIGIFSCQAWDSMVPWWAWLFKIILLYNGQNWSSTSNKLVFKVILCTMYTCRTVFLQTEKYFRSICTYDY